MIYRVTPNRHYDPHDPQRNHHPLRSKRYFVRDDDGKFVGTRSLNGIGALKNLDGVIIEAFDFDVQGDLGRLALFLKRESIKVSAG